MEENKREKLRRIAMGAVMAGGGAAITAVLTFIQGQDFGAYTPVVVALSSIALNAARVFFDQIR